MAFSSVRENVVPTHSWNVLENVMLYKLFYYYFSFYFIVLVFILLFYCCYRPDVLDYS